MFNLGGKSFDELVDAGLIDENTYPYARAGLKLYKLTCSFMVKLLLVVVCCFMLIKTLEHGSLLSLVDALSSRYPAATQVTGPVSDVTAGYVDGPFTWLLIALLAIWALLLLVYLFTAMRRNMFHERSVFSSDHTASAMRKRFLRQSAVSRRIADINRKQTSTGNGSARRLDFSSIAQRDALKCLQRTYFEVHKRVNIESGQLERRYIVTVPAATTDEAADKLNGLLKRLGPALTRLTNGKALFGDGYVLPDYTATQFIAVHAGEAALSAKQLARGSKRKANAANDVNAPEYETAFPFDLFPDQSEKLAKATAASTKWANATARSLDVLLATGEQPAERIGLTVTSAAVTYDYVLPFSLDMSAIDKLPKWIDQTFKTTGSTAEIHDGNLRIVIALPSKLTGFIYTRALYASAFGSSVKV